MAALVLLWALSSISHGQGINLGGLETAGRNIFSNVASDVASNAVPVIATAAQSALSNVQPTPESTASTEPSSFDSSTQSATSGPSTLATSASASSITSPTPLTSSSITSSQTASSSSSSSTSSPTSVDASSSAVEAATQSSQTADPDSKQSKNHTNTLLEIILPTVLSGLTLIALLALIFWICLRRRRNRRHRRSSLQHLYAAGSTASPVADGPAEMGERADSSLLHSNRNSYPVMEPGVHEHDAYEPQTTPVIPTQTMQRHSPRQSVNNNAGLHYPSSQFTASTSTNPGTGGSHSGGGSFVETFGRGARRSYQPVTTQMPHEPHTSVSGVIEEEPSYTHGGTHRARTPPLQAMFPWFGSNGGAGGAGGPTPPRRSSKRQSKSTASSTHYPTNDEVDDFSFGFQPGDATRRPTPPSANKRFSVPRKPLSGQYYAPHT